MKGADMLQLRLPALDSQAAPPWPDLAACEFWLSQLQVTDIRSAQEDIRSRLDLLNRCVVPAARRLETIEALRETVAFVQSEYRKRLIGRPLPFNESENAIFAGLMLLWESMAAGYQRCLQACIEGDAAIASGKALICQRLLRYAGVQILEHVLACLEVPPESWQELHCLPLRRGGAGGRGGSGRPIERSQPELLQEHLCAGIARSSRQSLRARSRSAPPAG